MSLEKPAADERIEALMNSWLDGELGPGEAEELAAFVSRDPALAQRMERLKQTVELIRREPRRRIADPGVFLTAVQRRIRRRIKGGFYGRHRLRFSYESLLTMVVLFAMLAAAQTLMFPGGTELKVKPASVWLSLQPEADSEKLRALGATTHALPGFACPLFELPVSAAGLDATRPRLAPVLTQDAARELAGVALAPGLSIRLLLYQGPSVKDCYRPRP